MPQPLDAPLLGKMRERYDRQVWNYFEFAFFTGMRPRGDHRAEVWSDVDVRAGMARITQTLPG